MIEQTLVDEDIAERVRCWIDESRDVLGGTLPALVRERDGLKARVKDVEDECGKLRGDNVSLRGELEQLRSQHDTLCRQHTEIVDQFNRFTGQMTQILGPMSELAKQVKDRSAHA